MQASIPNRATPTIARGAPFAGGAWLAFLVVVLLGHLPGFFQPIAIIPQTDVNAYLGGANGLVELGEYRFAEYVGHPRAGVYPPGNSLLLAVPRLMFGPQCDSTLAHGRWQLLVGAVSLGGVFRLFRAIGLPLIVSLGGIAAMMLSIHWQWPLIHCWPDAAFTGCVCAAASLWAGSGHRFEGLGRWHLTGLLLGFALLLRPAALPFLGAAGLAVCWGCWRRRNTSGWHRPLLAFSPWPLVASLVWGWCSLGSTTYGDAVLAQWGADTAGAGHSSRLWGNLWHLLGGRSLIDSVFPAWPRLIGFMTDTAPGLGRAARIAGEVAHLAVVIGVGFWIVRRGPVAWRWMLLGMLAEAGALVVMPFEVSTRHALVAAPFGIAWVYAAMASSLPTRGKGWCTVALAGALWIQAILSANWTNETMQAEYRWAARNRYAIEQMAGHLRRSVPIAARIAVGSSVDVGHLRVRSGREFVVDYLTRSMPWDAVSHAQQGFVPAEFLIAPDGYSVAPALDDVLTLVFRTGKTGLLLYRVNGDAERRWRARVGYPVPE